MSTTPIGSRSPLRSRSPLSRLTLASAFRRLVLSIWGSGSVFRRQAEAAREAVLERLPAARKARIGHEVLVRIERLLALRRANALGGTVAEDAPALLVVLEVRHHDLIQDLLVHRGIRDRHHHLDAAVEIAGHHVRRAD